LREVYQLESRFLKQWIVDHLKRLSSVFSMDVCAYAVMSNHYHVVLKVDVERAISWSDAEVLQRWRKLFKGNFLVERYLSGQSLTTAELNIIKETTAIWRQRLQDISWFMRCLNERIAREANQEDQVKGRFWEGRFKSQALLDEQALLSCMMYVDLNPIRAGLASTPEESEYTSIYERIKVASQPAKRGRPAKANKQKANNVSSPPLCPFADQVKKTEQDKAIAFAYQDYLELVDWTGRAIRANKRGAIPAHLLPILTRLGMANTGKKDPTEQWLKHIRTYRRRFACYAGSVKTLQRVSSELGRRWLKGQAA
jgi:putative transposase